ncbi:16S rRNA (uracil(1498)-N(3))-methyltransferase [Alloscardovia omnicolens]|uniref:16S rRNA (uracil(1498)-N(3))-methyltransferase n=1 Tax=Alloscardovia omnicolens TaxID=419015 RepID=UPI003A67B1D0
MTLPVFLLRDISDKNDTFPSTQGQLYTLPSSVAQHALKSMRMNDGEQLGISNGCGRIAVATIVDASTGSVRIDQIDEQKAPDIKLGLIQALAKSGRDEQAIEMATEIGVDSIMPWQSQRSIVQWKGNKAAKALNKWVDVVVSATQQSRRSFMPNVLEMKTTKQLIPWVKETVECGDIVLVLHQDATDTWIECEEHVRAAQSPCTVWVVVGPEGGISDEEVREFANAGAHVCVIGHNILRASSAGSVALALLSRVLERYA